jgi:hypothetical protein
LTDTFARSRRALGDNHSDTLLAAHLLANCLHEVGAFEQARRLNEDTLARRRRVLGDEHLDTQRTAHNLATDLRALGEVDAALQMHQDAVAYRERTLGDDHPLTINATVHLGASPTRGGRGRGSAPPARGDSCPCPASAR